MSSDDFKAPASEVAKELLLRAEGMLRSDGQSNEADAVWRAWQAVCGITPVDAVPGEPVDAETWAELYRLREAVKGPKGFATWQDAAVDERHCRVQAEAALAASVASRAGMEPWVLTQHVQVFGESDGPGTGQPLTELFRAVSNTGKLMVTVDTSRKQSARAPAEAKDAVRAELAPVEVSRLVEEVKRLMIDYCQAVLNCSERATDQNVKAVAHAESATYAAIDRLATMASTPASGVAGDLTEQAQISAAAFMRGHDAGWASAMAHAANSDGWVARVNQEGFLVEREGVAITEGSKLYLHAVRATSGEAS